jgi:hypothetical protein
MAFFTAPVIFVFLKTANGRETKNEIEIEIEKLKI